MCDNDFEPHDGQISDDRGLVSDVLQSLDRDEQPSLEAVELLEVTSILQEYHRCFGVSGSLDTVNIRPVIRFRKVSKGQDRSAEAEQKELCGGVA